MILPQRLEHLKLKIYLSTKKLKMRRQKYTIDEVKQFAIEKGGRCLSHTYEHNKSNLTWECGECNNTFNNTFKNVKYLGNWCPYCSGKHNNNIDTIKQLAKDRGGECLSEVYIKNKTNLTWKCGKCNGVWEARLDRVKSGTWCPRCCDSHGERCISNFLDSKNIKYKREYIFKNLKNRKYDFYLEDHNMLIEFDGLQHFQIYGNYTPDLETLEKNQKRDVEKTLFSIKNNIKLLRIHYNHVKYVDSIIEKSFAKEELLILTEWEPYNYIINKIDKTNILMFLTEVGKQ